MKLLALRIPEEIGGQSSPTSTTIPLPEQIANLNSQVGFLGLNGVKLIIDLLIFFGILLCLGFVLFGGFKWLISQGDKKKLEDARHTIIFSLVGLMVIFLSFLIVNIVLAFFNVPQFTP